MSGLSLLAIAIDIRSQSGVVRGEEAIRLGELGAGFAVHAGPGLTDATAVQSRRPVGQAAPLWTAPGREVCPVCRSSGAGRRPPRRFGFRSVSLDFAVTGRRRGRVKECIGRQTRSPPFGRLRKIWLRQRTERGTCLPRGKESHGPGLPPARRRTRALRSAGPASYWHASRIAYPGSRQPSHPSSG